MKRGQWLVFAAVFLLLSIYFGIILKGWSCPLFSEESYLDCVNKHQLYTLVSFICLGFFLIFFICAWLEPTQTVLSYYETS